ncbi:DUF3107 domain-containing protein [Propionibacteriaceae bacterium Y2011]|uniref:DUF3107 domain-containing protein n=1 Tax=Microlunatus sp. Y2014 TaxID=3418488 RepID=UPI003B49175F
MEIKVGVQHINREVVIEATESPDQVTKALTEALSNDGLLELTGERGRKVLIPAKSIGYVEFGEENARRVGFGTV